MPRVKHAGFNAPVASVTPDSSDTLMRLPRPVLGSTGLLVPSHLPITQLPDLLACKSAPSKSNLVISIIKESTNLNLYPLGYRTSRACQKCRDHFAFQYNGTLTRFSQYQLELSSCINPYWSRDRVTKSWPFFSLQSSIMARKKERYSPNAYFEMVLTSRLYDALPGRVATNPKARHSTCMQFVLTALLISTSQFWEFLESTQTKSYNERWADDMLRDNMDVVAAQLDDIRASAKALEVAKGMPSLEHMLLESEETLEAKIDSIPEGAKLHFFRDLCCVADEAEEEAEQAEMGYQPDSTARQRLVKRDTVTAGESEDRDQEASGSNASETEAERGSLEQDAETVSKVWEWTESDSEAEQWIFERDPVAAGGMAISPVEAESAWDWTQSDSDAEREEVERDSLERLRGSVP